jgi:hypothetical protein
VARTSRTPTPLRARTPQQLVSVVAIVIVEVAGVVAVVTGHRDLGHGLVGLGIVLLAPISLWMRRTNLPTKAGFDPNQ